MRRTALRRREDVSRLVGAAVGLAVSLAAPDVRAEAEAAASAQAGGVMVFGGVATDNDYGDFLLAPHEIDFSRSGLVGVAYSRRIANPADGVAVELEGQVVRHFGAQDHWEFNLPVAVARWRPFSAFDGSVAFGLGLSFSSETPALEVAQEGGSEPLLAYWAFELEAASPVDGWRIVGRLHHRSTAWGTFGDAGGLNSLVIGLRRRF